MADFPGKVNTQTSSSVPQRIPAMVDMDFIKSIPGILLATEIVSWKIILHFPCFVYLTKVLYILWLHENDLFLPS